MHATVHNFASPPHSFWDTPGASTSAAPSRFNSPYVSSQPSRPSSQLQKPAYVDPQFRVLIPPSPHECYGIMDASQPFHNPVSAPQSAGPSYLRQPQRGDLDMAAAQAQPYNPYAQPSLQHMVPQPSSVFSFYAPTAVQSCPTTPPGSHKRSPRLHPHTLACQPYPTVVRRDGRRSPKPESYYAPNAALLYSHAQVLPSPSPPGGAANALGCTTFPFSPSPVGGIPCRLPPILQVEKQQVTTTATQAASASRRRNEAHFICPVPGCGSTFTRRFNLRGASRRVSRTYRCPFDPLDALLTPLACPAICDRTPRSGRTSASPGPPSDKVAVQRVSGLRQELQQARRTQLRSEGGSECRQAAEAQTSAAGVFTSGKRPMSANSADTPTTPTATTMAEEELSSD
ncbi:hypothetical protein EW146_g5295 [Bondarzewia mesenterica]|uniref:Uncharacterized protein n=1 Tax=Bondarzewia mesenterica TaxID=1095465 RepID=A0A4S4LTT8_9AGAM|nr:hypothetical protein EW146_g5295 [Bondarzewia mesenterica]